MPILRVTPRKQAIRDRQRRQPDWDHNPDNPNMKVYTRLLLSTGFGTYDNVEMELDPSEMSRIARESLWNSEADRGKPNWDHDPLYYAAKRLRRIRRQRT
jgi:hypothetical protein